MMNAIIAIATPIVFAVMLYRVPRDLSAAKGRPAIVCSFVLGALFAQNLSAFLFPLPRPIGSDWRGLAAFALGVVFSLIVTYFRKGKAAA